MTQHVSAPGSALPRREGWKKSTFSDASGNTTCVEMRCEPGEMFGVGDTKNPFGPSTSFPGQAMRSFLACVKADEFSPAG